MRKTLCLALGFYSVASVAYAAAITNLSSHAQTVEVVEAGAARRVDIQPNATFRTSGKFELRFAGRSMNLEQDDEYAIWSDTEFGPQRKSAQGKSGRLL